MNYKTARFFYGILASLLLLAACVPPPQPTQSPEDIQDQIATSVALTVEAQNAQTAAAQPIAAPATEIPLPTATVFIPPTPILPTATPFVVVPPPASGGSGGGNPTQVLQYACAVVSEKPRDGASFKPGDSFDKVWVLKNTGRKTWQPGWGWQYFKGEAMSPTANSTLGKEVKTGETIELRIEVTAPLIDRKDTGKVFVMWWAVVGDGSKFCTPYVAIRVVYPGTNP